jgi:hypothetical protein
MWSKLINQRRKFFALLLIGLLLSVSACFEWAEPGESYRNQAGSQTAVTKTVTVTVTPSVPDVTSIQSASVKPGIVGIWTFDNNASDSSGSGNNGNIIGGATLTDSMSGFGKALKSGINSHGAMIPDSFGLDISTNLTMEAWVKLDSLPDRSPVVSKVSNKANADNQQNSYQLQVGADGHVGMSVWKTQKITTFLRGDTLLNLGQWYHLAGSYEYKGDGTSVMKVFVDDRLDGELNDAVGPIFVGTGELVIGRLNGIVDEVHVWNTSWADYSLTVNPLVEISQPGSSHTITAIITPTAPGVKVHFDVLPDGTNCGQTAIASTNNKGIAAWTYSDKGFHEGMDNIQVWVDRDGSGIFEESNDASVMVNRIWLKEFAFGSGNIMDGNKIIWTFGGSFGMLGRNMFGEFELVDHVKHMIYRTKFLNPSNNSMPSTSQWLPGNFLPDDAKIASFSGIFTNNKDSSTIDLSIWVMDAGDTVASQDRISIKTGTGNSPGTIWIGTPNPNWTSLNSAPFSIAVPISNGVIKVYKTN